MCQDGPLQTTFSLGVDVNQRKSAYREVEKYEPRKSECPLLVARSIVEGTLSDMCHSFLSSALKMCGKEVKMAFKVQFKKKNRNIIQNSKLATVMKCYDFHENHKTSLIFVCRIKT